MKCSNCGAETTNGLTLCKRCQTTWTIALVNVSAYHADVSRIQPGQRVRVRSAYMSTPPPATVAAFDRFADVIDATENALTTWVRVLVGDRPQVAPTAPGAAGPERQAMMRRLKLGQPEFAGLDVRYTCAWFEHHKTTVCTLDWAGEMLRDLLAAERKLRKVVDNADTGWYAGICGSMLIDERPHDGTTCGCVCHDGGDCDVPGGCGAEYATIEAVTCERGLYATPGTNWIRCPECGATHDVGQRRDEMERLARDEHAPVRAIAKMVVGLVDTEVSEERLAKRIDKWVERGRLRSLGVRVIDGVPRRVYRIGDVFDLVKRDRDTSQVPGA